MKLQIIQRGAEALIYRSGSKILKERIKKSYRNSELDDKIRKTRTRSEIKLLNKASELINSPKASQSAGNLWVIEMPFLDGKKLSEYLDRFTLNKQKAICKRIGESVAKLHENNIIHGDLTTSNMILMNNKVFLIDFGLGYISNKAEDKAVDIHLFKESLEAKHFKKWEILFKEFLKRYAEYAEHKKILEQLKKVEAMGRYRH